MAGVNKAILVGHLGKDPEIRHLENDRAVANFSLATSESYTNKQGERVTNTEWHNIVLWGGLAKLAEKYLKKGNQIYLEGRITNRSYEDKEGITKYRSEIVGQEMTFLGGSRGDSGDNASAPKASENVNDGSSEIDDLPF